MKKKLDAYARCPFYFFDTDLSVTCFDNGKKVRHKFADRAAFEKYTKNHCLCCFPADCKTFKRFWSKY